MQTYLRRGGKLLFKNKEENGDEFGEIEFVDYNLKNFFKSEEIKSIGWRLNITETPGINNEQAKLDGWDDSTTSEGTSKRKGRGAGAPLNKTT